jgi:hypothetical protein
VNNIGWGEGGGWGGEGVNSNGWGGEGVSGWGQYWGGVRRGGEQ